MLGPAPSQSWCQNSWLPFLLRPQKAKQQEIHPAAPTPSLSESGIRSPCQHPKSFLRNEGDGQSGP